MEDCKDRNMETIKYENDILIKLSNDEAIVFLHWLFRFNNNDTNHFFEDTAEQRILWDIEAVLEKVVSESLASNFQDILLKARQKIRELE